MASGRDYGAERRRRDELARLRGFKSYATQRRAPRRLRGTGDFARLPGRARESRSESLRVIDLARSDRVTVETAARQLGVPMSTVRFWAPEALEPTRRGRTLPRDGDRLTRLRPLFLEGEDEVTFVAARGSRAADRADQVFDVQWRFLTGHADLDELEQIRGITIAGRRVESDPARLEYLGNIGAADPDEVYRTLIG